MAKNGGIKMSLPTSADLFSTQEERDEAERESVHDIVNDGVTGVDSANGSFGS